MTNMNTSEGPAGPRSGGCTCPRKTCENNGDCRACVAKHRNTDSLTYCMFPDNDGDKSLKSFYRKLRERFGDEGT